MSHYSAVTIGFFSETHERAAYMVRMSHPDYPCHFIHYRADGTVKHEYEGVYGTLNGKIAEMIGQGFIPTPVSHFGDPIPRYDQIHI